MNLGFRLAKIADIGFITILYFLSGFFMARLFDNYLDKYDKKYDDKKSNVHLILEIAFYLWVNGIAIYIVRNLVELIPSPFHGLYGLKHDLLTELKSAPILEFTFLYYQVHLTDKLKNLYNRFSDD
jgi:hypothetical protein